MYIYEYTISLFIYNRNAQNKETHKNIRKLIAIYKKSTWEQNGKI